MNNLSILALLPSSFGQRLRAITTLALALGFALTSHAFSASTLTLDAVTGDDTISATDQSGTVTVTGSVTPTPSAASLAGANLILTLNKFSRRAIVASNGVFSYTMTEGDFAQLGSGTFYFKATYSAADGVASAYRSVTIASPTSKTISGTTYLGMYTVPDTKFTNPNSESSGVAGLSGVDFDAVSGNYYFISDAKSAPRAYEVSATRSAAGAITDVTVVRTIPLGSANTLDGESVRVWRQGGAALMYVSSEGLASAGLQPTIQERTLNGEIRMTYTLPSNLVYVNGTSAGPRNNMILEGLTLSPDGSTLYVSLEQPLATDGAAPTLTTGATTRIVAFNRTTGAAIKQVAYAMDPIFLAENQSALAPATTSFNGVSEILAVDNNNLLVLERAIASKTGFGVRVYKVNVGTAADVSGTTLSPNYAGAMPKTKVLEVIQTWSGGGTLPSLLVNGVNQGSGALQNIEGMTFGPKTSAGKGTLYLVNDNNYNAGQANTILSFEVTP